LQRGVPHGLSSPNWPHNYTSDALCLWWIKVRFSTNYETCVLFKPSMEISNRFITILKTNE